MGLPPPWRCALFDALHHLVHFWRPSALRACSLAFFLSRLCLLVASAPYAFLCQFSCDASEYNRSAFRNPFDLKSIPPANPAAAIIPTVTHGRSRSTSPGILGYAAGRGARVSGGHGAPGLARSAEPCSGMPSCARCSGVTGTAYSLGTTFTPVSLAYTCVNSAP